MCDVTKYIELYMLIWYSGRALVMRVKALVETHHMVDNIGSPGSNPGCSVSIKVISNKWMFQICIIMSVMCNECIALLKRQNAKVVPNVEFDFHSEEEEEDEGFREFLDRNKEIEIKLKQERKRIKELEENIKIKK